MILLSIAGPTHKDKEGCEQCCVENHKYHVIYELSRNKTGQYKHQATWKKRWTEVALGRSLGETLSNTLGRCGAISVSRELF